MDKIFSQDSIENLIIGFLCGELTMEEEHILFDWVNKSHDNYLLFDQYRKVWIGSVNETEKTKFDPSNALRKLEESGSLFKEVYTDKKNRGLFIHMNNLVKIAAIFIISFLLGFMSSLLINRKQLQPDYFTEIAAPLGSRSNVVLPDGSRVWLNSGSILTYPKSFNEKNRHVYLKGEAFFKVAGNKNKPFIVHTPAMDIKALGTSFNVKAYPDDKTTGATLVEGVIEIDIKDKSKNHLSYTLKPKQNLFVQNREDSKNFSKKNDESKKDNSDLKETQPIDQFDSNVQDDQNNVQFDKNVDVELYTSWKDNQWVVKGESLGSFAKLLERRFNVKIHLMSEKLNLYKFTGTIQNETFEQVLQYIKLTAPIKFEISKGEVWWYTDTQTEPEYSKILNKISR